MVHWTYPKDPDAPVDEALLHALHQTKDRGYVLTLEKAVRAFLASTSTPNDTPLTFPTTKFTYHRMLAHKVAQYYQLKTASIDLQGKGSQVMAAYTEGMMERASLQMTPLSELVPASTVDAAEYASNDSEHGRSMSEGWASDNSSSAPSQPPQPPPPLQQPQQPARFTNEPPASRPGRASPSYPPSSPMLHQQAQYPAPFDYQCQMPAGTATSMYSPGMTYSYPSPMQGYPVPGNNMYVSIPTGMPAYGMHMVQPGSPAMSNMYPPGYAPMSTYPPSMMGQMGHMGQDGQMMGQVPSMMAYVMPAAAPLASSPPTGAMDPAQQYAQHQYQQHMAGRRPASQPGYQPHSGPPSPYSNSNSPRPPQSSRFSASHMTSPQRVNLPQAPPPPSRVSASQAPTNAGGYFGTQATGSILNHQNHPSYPLGPDQGQHLHQYPPHQQDFQHGYSKGGKGAAVPPSGTIKAIKGEMQRMYNSPGAPAQSPPASPQQKQHQHQHQHQQQHQQQQQLQQQQQSRVRRPTVDVENSAGDAPEHDSNFFGNDADRDSPENPSSVDLSAGGGQAQAYDLGDLGSCAAQLSNLQVSSRLRRTSTPNSPAGCRDLPAGSPLPTPRSYLKPCTSPSLRASSSGACSPSYQRTSRSSTSGISCRRVTVNGSVGTYEPKKEGAFGLKAVMAASAAAAAIILKPGLNGRSSPINLSIHCPPGMRRPPPESVLCPLSGQVMKDPVFLIATGLTYDRASLESIMQDGKGICPTTGAAFDKGSIVPNQHAKQVVLDWMRFNPEPEPRKTDAGNPPDMEAEEGYGSPADRSSCPDTQQTLDMQEVAGACIDSIIPVRYDTSPPGSQQLVADSDAAVTAHAEVE